MKSSSGPALLLFAAFVAALSPAAFASDSPTAKTEATATNSPVATPKPNDESDEPTVTEPAKPDPVAADYWRAIKLLGSKSATDVEAGRVALKAAADLEYTHAQVLLGNCHLSGGYGFPKSPKKAASLFRLAAERGNAFAKVSLGLCYVTGNGLRKDEEAAIKWLTGAIAPDADYSRPSPPADFSAERSGAEAGESLSGNLGEDPVAQSVATAHHLLGEILMRQKKHAEAQPHFVAAAGNDGRSGIFQAAQQAALNYAFGQGTARDLAKANEMLERARKLTSRMGVTMVHNYASLKIVDEFAVADLEEKITEAGAQAQTEMQTAIAEQFANKKSKDYNPAEAAKWYELAAENGQVWAMLSLAFIYSRGDLGQPDPAKAYNWFEKAGGGEKPKHTLGIANLAICYQNGIGIGKDTAKADALFKKHKDIDIVCYLGTLGKCPEKIITFEEELALIQTWAKKNNDAHAQYLLGDRYDSGAGMLMNKSDAANWYKKAVKANHPLATYRLAVLHDNHPFLVGNSTLAGGEKNAVELFRRGSELKNPDAMVHYAYMLMNGDGLARNTVLAVETYEKCLELYPDEYHAHNNLGAYYANKLVRDIAGLNREEVETLRKKTLMHYEAAIRGEHATAARNLAVLYHEGVLVGKDLRKAYQYYEQAAAWGYGPEAHYSLGLMHENGEGVPVTYSEAAYHYRLAAVDGHIEALQHLVNFYLTGKGVSRDLDRASFWLIKMMRAGEPGVLVIYVDILLKKQEYNEAVGFLNDLRYNENTFIAGFAYDRLSQCYRNGLGVKANPDKARQYFDKAVKLENEHALTTLAMQQLKEGKKTEAVANLQTAAKNSGPASFYLGQMNFFGTNVPKDRVKAMQYLRAAAALEHPEALYFLAGLTYNREADAPSINEAIDLLQRAENVGHPKAADLREKLELRRQKNQSAPEETAKAKSS